MTTKTPIGQIKTKVIVHCSLCGCSHKRNLKINVYENTQIVIKRAKIELKEKAKKEYTCKTCKTIQKDIENEN